MSITVLDPGPLTTVQDAGRVGYAAQATAAAAQRTDTPTVWAMCWSATTRVQPCWNAPCAARPCGLKRTPSLL